MARIQGITIQLDADGSGVEKALKDVDKASSRTTKELSQINRALKFDPGNTTLLQQRMDVLSDAVQNTSKRLEALKQAKSEVDRQFEAGEIDASTYRAFQREIEQTQGRLEAFKRQAEDTQVKIKAESNVSKIVERAKSDLRELGTAAKNAATEIGSALGNIGTAGAAATFGLVTGMQEANQDLAMLETQISQVGLALEDIEGARSAFNSVGQGVDQISEAMGNLVQAGYQTEEALNNAAEGISGAIVKYGDTFSAEGLAESITTTTQLGEVTGQFMDLLEKEGVNVEDFNAKLESMSSAEERANLVSQTLADQGLNSVFSKYQEMNPEVTKNAEAQQQLQDALSQLSIVLAPFVTAVTEVVTKLVEWATNNPELATTIAIVSTAIAGIAGAFAALAPVVSAIMSLWPVLTAAFSAMTGPIGIAVAAIAGLVTAGVLLYNNWSEIKTKAQEIWGSLSEWFSETFEKIKSVFENGLNAIDQATGGKFQLITDTIRSYLEMIWKNVEEIWRFIQDTFQNGIQFITSLIEGDFKSAGDAMKYQLTNISEFFSNIWGNIKDFFAETIKNIVDEAKKKFEEFQKNIENAQNKAKSLFEKIWNNIKSFFSTIINSIISTVQSKFSEMVSTVSNKMSEVRSTIEAKWNEAKSFLQGIDLRQIGRNIISGLVGGIKDKFSDVKSVIQSLGGNVTTWAKDILGIASPSKVMRDEIGKMIPLGVAEGVEDHIDIVANMTKRMAQMTIPDLSRMPQIKTLQTSASPVSHINSNTINFERMLEGATFVVREEADIRKIARELHHLTKSSARSNGVIMQ